MNKILLLLILLSLSLAPAANAAAPGDGESLYPLTRPIADFTYGQTVDLRDFSGFAPAPGHAGWLSWNGSNSVEDLAAALTPPGTSHDYYNPGEPANNWTPDFDDTRVDIGDWVQGMPGRGNSEDVRTRLDWLIARKAVIVIPLYDAIAGQGANAYYHVHAFAAFELQSYDLNGKTPSITAKFLRWVANGGW